MDHALLKSCTEKSGWNKFAIGKETTMSETIRPELSFDIKTSALVLIDLQRSIVGRDTAPYKAMDVVRNCAALAKTLRRAGALIVYVNVDVANFLKLPTDKSLRDPHAPPAPAGASDIVPEAGMEPGDLRITKRQWGAFFGTDLEAQLRQRDIKTIILGGIATNYGVESTARAASGLGFELITVEDAITGLNAEAHRFACENILPYLGRMRSTREVLETFQ